MRLSIVAILCLIAASSYCQADFLKLVNDYYRVDPFQGSFSAFYNALKNDRSLLKKELTLSESGESLDVSGIYKIFNPFGINADSIKISLRHQGIITYYSIPSPIYAYEVTGLFADSRYARTKIADEMWLISNRMRRLYVNSKKEVLRKRDMVVADTADVIKFWFKNLTLFKAAELNWKPLADSGTLELQLKCYFVVINNYAYPLGHYPGRGVDHFNDLGNWRKY